MWEIAQCGVRETFIRHILQRMVDSGRRSFGKRALVVASLAHGPVACPLVPERSARVADSAPFGRRSLPGVVIG
jgi:hypothetical protein